MRARFSVCMCVYVSYCVWVCVCVSDSSIPQSRHTAATLMLCLSNTCIFVSRIPYAFLLSISSITFTYIAFPLILLFTCGSRLCLVVSINFPTFWLFSSPFKNHQISTRLSNYGAYSSFILAFIIVRLDFGEILLMLFAVEAACSNASVMLFTSITNNDIVASVYA